MAGARQIVRSNCAWRHHVSSCTIGIPLHFRSLGGSCCSSRVSPFFSSLPSLSVFDSFSIRALLFRLFDLTHSSPDTTRVQHALARSSFFFSGSALWYFTGDHTITVLVNANDLSPNDFFDSFCFTCFSTTFRIFLKQNARHIHLSYVCLQSIQKQKVWLTLFMQSKLKSNYKLWPVLVFALSHNILHSLLPSSIVSVFFTFLFIAAFAFGSFAISLFPISIITFFNFDRWTLCCRLRRRFGVDHWVTWLHHWQFCLALFFFLFFLLYSGQ